MTLLGTGSGGAQSIGLAMENEKIIMQRHIFKVVQPFFLSAYIHYYIITLCGNVYRKISSSLVQWKGKVYMVLGRHAQGRAWATRGWYCLLHFMGT